MSGWCSIRQGMEGAGGGGVEARREGVLNEGSMHSTQHSMLAHRTARQLPPAARCQVLWPRDMFHGGNRGCRDGTDARLMRALLHAMHGTRLPTAGSAPPATITLQRKSANRRIVNEEEVVEMLREFGEVCGQRVALARVAEAGAWAANSRG